MDIQLKQRLVGAAVLVGVSVIFLPMLLDNSAPDDRGIMETNIPPMPEGGFSSRVIPMDPSLATGHADSSPEFTAIGEEKPENKGLPASPGTVRAPVAVRELRTESTSVNAWVVQIGSFSSEKNARELEAKLDALSYQAFIDPARGPAGTTYRVRIGPEFLRSAAEQLRDKLEKATKMRGMVLKYP